MPSLSLPSRLIWFAHCPKAGGTSVEQAMVARWGNRVGHLDWGWDRWWTRGGWRVADPPNSPQHLTWKHAEAVLPSAPDAVFALVRDPVARMVSEYRWQRAHRRGTWAGWWLSHLPFSLWLRLMMAMFRRNPFTFDNHFRPQSDFVPADAKVFRLEDGLAPLFDWLARETGAAPIAAPPHALRTGGSTPVLTAADHARIGHAFDIDYVRFGYVRLNADTPRRDGLDLLAAGLAPMLGWLDRRGRL